jgi:hypothetical protein
VDAPTLSSGEPSTLGVWLTKYVALFGTNTKGAKFLYGKIAEQGEDQAVLADEGQFLNALLSMDAII